MGKGSRIGFGVALLVAAATVFAVSRTYSPAALPAPKLKAAAPKRAEGTAPPPIWDAPAFAFVDQDNRPIAKSSLKGKVWIADFIFTRCGHTCPIMTGKMVELQKQVTHPDVTFVSFSVDPDRDKPADLKAYAAKYQVDESRWRFLAPPDAKSILDFAIGMRVAGTPKEDNNPLLHADRFLLVDRKGKVCGSYYAGDAAAMSRLASDAVAVARQQPDRE